MSAGDCNCAARAMLLIVAPLKPFSENSSNAASKICPRRSDSSAKSLLLDRTFNTRRIPLIEHLVKYLETAGGMRLDGSCRTKFLVCLRNEFPFLVRYFLFCTLFSPQPQQD